MKVIKHVFVAGVLIPVGVLLLMVLADIVRPYKPIEVAIPADLIVYPESVDPDDIRHPDNWEYVQEIAFNLGVAPEEVTQSQFNERYVYLK